MQTKLNVGQWRRALWHLRKGGLSQYREWRRREALRDMAPVRALRQPGTGSVQRFDPMAVAPYQAVLRPKAFGGTKVAVIMDDFSLGAWGHEFETVAVTPSAWREQLDGVSLLLVESAWHGNGDAWQYQLTGSKAPSLPLRDLVAHCRTLGIPTVFWNKEDPPHFEDFLDTAALFDHVFTTDSNKLPAYRERLGHDRVGVLNFAAQPAIHNPIRSSGVAPEGDVAFAGMYFAHKYPERRTQLELLLGAAEAVSARMQHGLTIYSRFADDEKYAFPEPYSARVVGSLPYDKMLSAYRIHKVFLNVNSVVDSPSMCARRVFEITASGTPVVSAHSDAIGRFFPQDEVPVVTDEEEARYTLRALVNSASVRDRMVHRAQRRIWQEHTYTHRAAQVFRAAGLEAEARRTPSVTGMISTNRPHQVGHALSQLGRQVGVDVQVALLTHGFEVDEAETRALARDVGIQDLVILRGDEGWLLGDCLNALIDVADGDLVAKIDDDDLYGPNYLLDQANAQWFSGADLVGKEASYLYVGSEDAMVLRNPHREHRWTTFVAGPTLMGPRSVFRDVRFGTLARGEDTDFLRRLGDSGGRVYSADRFNFIQVRGAVQHTWQVSDMVLLANGLVESYGLNEAHAFVD